MLKSVFPLTRVKGIFQSSDLDENRVVERSLVAVHGKDRENAPALESAHTHVCVLVLVAAHTLEDACNPPPIYVCGSDKKRGEYE